MDYQQKAREILSKILYITIATASRKGEPWNTPVYAAFDERYNFFWASWKGTQHSLNISENEEVFLVVYDSTAPEGAGEGVYIKAKAYELTEPVEIEHAIKYSYARKNKTPRKTEEFMDEYPRRMYKAVPTRIWINLDSDVKGNHIDTRKEITLL